MKMCGFVDSPAIIPNRHEEERKKTFPTYPEYKEVFK